MRFLLWCIILGGLGGTAWFWVAHDRTQSIAAADARRADANALIGVRRMLADHPAHTFSSIVVGLGDVDGRDFRARVLREGRLVPSYGQTKRLCGGALSEASCWHLSHLEIDGEVIAVPEPDSVAAEAPSDEIETADIPAAEATAKMPEAALAGADALRNDPANPDAPRRLEPTRVAIADIRNPETANTVAAAQESAALASLHKDPQIDAKADSSPTHLVARPVINARSGPGTTNAVLGKLTAGTALELITRDGRWGQFRVLDEGGPAEPVWVAMSILEALP